MEKDRRLLIAVIGVLVFLGILGWRWWAVGPNEYHGILRYNGDRIGIPEDPPPLAYLETASCTYELAFPRHEVTRWNSDLRYKLRDMDGKEVIVRGGRSFSRRRGIVKQPVIWVYDVKLSPSPSPTAPLLRQSA